MKSFLIIPIVMSLFCLTTYGQTELLTNLTIDKDVLKTTKIKLTVGNSVDTILHFEINELRSRTEHKENGAITNMGKYSVTFEYLLNEKWKKTEYEFLVEGPEKRIEVYLDFDLNDSGTEYLKDLTVSKVYESKNFSIAPAWELKRGKKPVYKIFSQSDTTVYGESGTGHFYGTILYQVGDAWKAINGSYCMSTKKENPLIRGDSVYSYLPSYSPGDEFLVKLPGQYKYIVTMGTQKYAMGILTTMVQLAKTRTRTLTRFEVESDFKIQ